MKAHRCMHKAASRTCNLIRKVNIYRTMKKQYFHNLKVRSAGLSIHQGIPKEAGNNLDRGNRRGESLLSTQSIKDLHLFYLNMSKNCQMKSVLKFTFLLEVNPRASLSSFFSQENGISHHCSLPV